MFIICVTYNNNNLLLLLMISLFFLFIASNIKIVTKEETSENKCWFVVLDNFCCP